MASPHPEKNFTYWFAFILIFQAICLFNLCYFSYSFDTFYWGNSNKFTGIAKTEEVIKNSSVSSTPYLPPIPLLLSTAGNYIFSGSKWGGSIFHIVLGLTGMGLFFSFLSSYLDARTAFYSCCILVSSLIFNWNLQSPTPPGLETIFLLTAIFGFFLYLKTNQHQYFWITYGSIGLGILSSGLVALVLPVLTLVIYLMFRIKMNKGTLEKIRFGKGILFSLLICLPGILYASWISEGEWFWNFLAHPWLGYSPLDYGEESPFYLPFIFIIIGILPLGFFLPASFGYCWKLRQKKPLLLLSTLGLLIVLFIYAFFDGFQPSLLLPGFAFASVLIGYQLSQLKGRSLNQMKLYTGFGGTIIIAAAIPVGLFLILKEASLSSNELIQFYLMMIVPPIAIIALFLFWKWKKTDEGMVALTIGFGIFNVLLIAMAKSQGLLREIFILLIS